MYTNETKKQWKSKKIIDQRKWSMCSLHSASTATQKETLLKMVALSGLMMLCMLFMAC